MNRRVASASADRGPGNCPEDTRTGLHPTTIARAFRDNLYYLQARFPEVTTPHDNYMALAYTVRERLLQRWINTASTYLHRHSRTVCYLSAEFLMGPQLGNNLVNLGIFNEVRQAMQEVGLDLDELLDQEEEPGLGNGGLGRLAACFLDSLATLQIPSIGYGIRYEFGIFKQMIRDGWQVEMSDKWLMLGNPWEIPRPEICFDVPFGGRTEPYEENGRYRVRWIPDRVVRGVAYDTAVLGYQTNTVNLLRLWKAEATHSFDFQAFNTGDYYGAVLEKIVSENITKVLYPNDESPQGKQLRLQQQYFFASCALQDMLRLYFQRSRNLAEFQRKFAVQLNDTHPAIAVAELMRLLVDEYQMGWDEAWDITQQTFGYTNHTLLPEALERWSVPLFGSLLPRHLAIIYEINYRFLQDVRRRFPNDEARAARLSLIDESGERYVRMAHLACVGSHTINGVAQLHSDLLKQGIFRDFCELAPQRFTNVTNGITPRRFMVLSNPRLAELLTRQIGGGWVKDLEALRRLEPLAEDRGFRKEWRRIKLANKADLASFLKARTGIEVAPNSLFDIQVKRFHEYKRQHLNLLHILTLFVRLRRGLLSAESFPPRTFIFGGKAAPGYFMAKLIIKLINAVAEAVNNDPQARGLLTVVFLPDLNVKNTARVYPAAELSEQISTAGKEASGTGNMKFALNGALTIGTLDGANTEIRERVGADNFFLFGLTAPEVQQLRADGYQPRAYYEANPELREVLDLIASGFFSPRDPGLFHPLVDHLLQSDTYMLLADYAAYVACQEEVSAAYRDQEQWTRASILNVTRLGYFSSDRSIREYCEKIWNIPAVTIDLAEEDAKPASTQTLVGGVPDSSRQN
jgi:starch phosphorylase